MKSLTTKEVEKLDKILRALLEELKSQYELGESATNTVTLDQSKVGRLSRMDAMQQQKMAESNHNSTEIRLKKVQTALLRISAGEYGDCDECGLPIALARLLIQPEALYCIECQALQEQ